MVVVVDVPDGQRGGSLGFAGPGAGVEQLFGQGAVVPLNLAVVSWGVRADPLVPRGDGQHGAGERLGGVVGAVVGDDPHESHDAVGGEEGAGPVEEPDRGDRLLVGQVLGVGQAGEPVHRGVQVDVPGLGAPGLGPLSGLVGGGPATVGAPAAAVGDAPDLLDVQVHHVAGVAGGDPPDRAVGLPVGVDVAAPVDPQPHQPPADRGQEHLVPGAGQLEVDLAGGPLVRAAPGLDLLDQARVQLTGAVVWGAGPVEQSRLAELVVAGFPLRQALA